MNTRPHSLAAVLLAALLHTIPAQAVTISGDSFSASMAEDSLGQIALDGSLLPAPGIAGLPGLDLATDHLEIDWLDEDTFTLRVTLAADLANLKILIEDLSFKEGLNPASITGVTFDDATTPQETYAGYEGISGPSVTSTANSIEVTFGAFPPGPAADGIPWYFNVQASHGTTPSVPDQLPTGFAGLALGGLALVCRRWQKR